MVCINIVHFIISESKADANGVLREVWYGYSTEEAAGFEDLNEMMADSVHIIQNFKAPAKFDDLYGQKLTTYFQV